MATLDEPAAPPLPRRPSEPPLGPSAEQIADRVFAAGLGAFDTLCIYLGERLGWYDALAGAGAVAAGELALRTGTNERYAREWLEQQAASGYLHAMEGDQPAARRFELPAGATEVFTDRSSLNYL